MLVLGISAFYHDSAAALVRDGEIVAAAQEERFSRKKGDSDFPTGAVKFCLESCGVSVDEIDFVGFYDKPLLTFDRLLETYLGYAPKGLPSFRRSIPLWVKEKLLIKKTVREQITHLGLGDLPERKVSTAEQN